MRGQANHSLLPFLLITKSHAKVFRPYPQRSFIKRKILKAHDSKIINRKLWLIEICPFKFWMNDWMTKYHLIFLKMMHFTLIFDRMMVAMMSIFYSLNIKENAMQSHKVLTRRFYFGINFVSNKLILYCAERSDLIRFCPVKVMAKI